MKSSLGFTLVELIVTMAVVAILLVLAVPGFGEIIRTNRASAQTNDLVSALSLARSEAVRRGAAVDVCPSSNQITCTGGTDWEDGWIIQIPGAPAALLRAWGPLEGGSTLSGPAQVTYGALGEVNAVVVFQHRVAGCSGNQGRDLTISLTGRADVALAAC